MSQDSKRSQQLRVLLQLQSSIKPNCIWIGKGCLCLHSQPIIYSVTLNIKERKLYFCFYKEKHSLKQLGKQIVFGQ